ncbi:MAG: hypothetical protein HYS22_06870 [Deltaproteobacteria bacterium]|nr:hypothetical protein [Deltaproteobacteria bacterium]
MNELEFEEWKVVFYRLAESELKLLLSPKKEQLKGLKKQAKLIREFVRKVAKVVLDPRYNPIEKITRHLELNRLLDIQDEAKRIETMINKHQKKGPKTWPKGIKRMLINALEQSKGDQNPLERIRLFLSARGELRKWLKSLDYENLLAVTAINFDPTLPTKWANDLKRNMIRSYVLENYPDAMKHKRKFKKYKGELLNEIRVDIERRRNSATT